MTSSTIAQTPKLDPIQQERMFKLAKAFHSGNEDPRAKAEYLQLVGELSDIKTQLNCYQSIKRRVQLKQASLPIFKPWIEGSIQGLRPRPDNILANWLVWVLDIEELELAERLARFCIAHDLGLPFEFTRNIPTFYLDEIARLAKRKRELGQSFKITTLKTALLITKGEDIPEVTLAKVYREMGYLQYKRNSKASLVSFRKAFELDQNCGVRTELKKAERRFGNQPPASGKKSTKKSKARSKTKPHA